MSSTSSPSAAAFALAFLVSVISTTVQAASVVRPIDYYDGFTTRCVPSTSVFKDEHKNHICKMLFPGFSFISVPNPWDAGNSYNDSYTIERALNEFRIYSASFQRERFCSDKIYNLLCFFFFPPCSYDTKAKAIPVFPCRDICEEVTDESSECTRQLIEGQTIGGGKVFENKTNLGWPVYFKNCNYSYKISPNAKAPVYKDKVCVDETHSITLHPGVNKITKEVDACGTVGRLQYIHCFLQVIDLNLLSFFVESNSCNCNPRLSVSGNVLKRNTYSYGKLLATSNSRNCYLI